MSATELSGGYEAARIATAEIFGSASPALVRAVAPRLAHSLDRANLSMLAVGLGVHSEHPLVSNPTRLVAAVNELPITNVDIPTVPVDKRRAVDFRRILEAFPGDMPRLFVVDLLKTSTVEMLEYCPPELLSPAARDLVMNKLVADVRTGRAPEVVAAVKSTHADATLLRLAFERCMRAKRPNGDVSAAIAASPFAEVRALERLSTRKERKVQVGLGSNPKLPADLIESIVQSLDWKGLNRIAGGATASPAMLERLSRFAHADVRASVGANRSAPASVLTALASDKDEVVRKSVAGNTSAPPEVLRTLAVVTPEELMNVTFDDGTRGDWLSRREPGRESILGILAENPSLPVDIVIDWAGSQTAKVRHLAARSIICPPEVLSNLSRDVDIRVIIAVAANTGTPSVVLEALSVSRNPQVRQRVAANPSTSSRVLAGLSERNDNFLRDDIVKNPSTSVETLTLLKRSRAANVSAGASKALAQRIGRRDGDFDVHSVMRSALKAPDDQSHAVEMFADDYLQQTVDAMSQGLKSSVQFPRKWSDLPNTLDVPFEVPPHQSGRMLQSHPIGGLRFRLVSTGRELTLLSLEMGNCLRQFIGPVRRRESAVAWAEDVANDEIYAVAWKLDLGGWTFEQVNSRFNENQVPRAVSTGLMMTTDEINSLYAGSMGAEANGLGRAF